MLTFVEQDKSDSSMEVDQKTINEIMLKCNRVCNRSTYGGREITNENVKGQEKKLLRERRH